MTKILRSIMIVWVSLVLAACSGFGSNDSQGRVNLAPKTTALGVNGYLWQATLDTLNFMPIDQADPAAAVILTGWHSEPSDLNERVKLTVQFTAQALRSDGVKVTVLRQIRENNIWVAAPVQASTALTIEEAILTKARMLKVAQVN